MRSIKQCVFGVSFFVMSGFGSSVYADWSPPVQIFPGPSSVNPSGTPLVINSHSSAVVGWLNGDIGLAESLSSASLFPQSSAWSTPQQIYANSTPGFVPSFPTLSLDEFDNQVAAFGVFNFVSGFFDINASRRVDSAPWPAPIIQTENGFPDAGSVANDELGNVAAFLALTTTSSPPFDLTFLQLSENSSAWGTPIVIAQDTSANPVVAIKITNGFTVLAWKISSPSLQLQTSMFNFASQTLTPLLPVPLPPSAVDITDLELALDSKQDAVLIYVVDNGTGTALYSSTLIAGQTAWSSPLLISDPANDVGTATIATDAVGNATIVWEETIAPTQDFIRVASLPLGGTIGPVTNLTDPTNTNAVVTEAPKVVMDSFGNAAAIWAIELPSSTIQVSSKAIGQNWTTPETLSISGVSPLIALSDQGTAVATWIDEISSILFGTRNLFLFPLSSPSQFVGTVEKNEFLTQKTYFLNMQWDPSLAPNISYYQIFRNGQLIATIPGTGPFDVLQHIGSKNVKDSYTLVATASNGNKNPPVPLVIK